VENYWIQVQRKSFSRWCNTVLNKRSIEIKDLEHDFRDGRNLIQLLEILTSKSIKYNKNPRIDVQMMENLTVALKFLKEECAVHLVNIGPNDIHDGNLKLILGLIWALILHLKLKPMPRPTMGPIRSCWIGSTDKSPPIISKILRLTGNQEKPSVP